MEQGWGKGQGEITLTVSFELVSEAIDEEGVKSLWSSWKWLIRFPFGVACQLNVAVHRFLTRHNATSVQSQVTCPYWKWNVWSIKIAANRVLKGTDSIFYLNQACVYSI